MKKIIPFLCAALLLCGMGFPAKAAETSLSFTIPRQHTVTIESANGRIVADGAIRGEEVDLERHRKQTYWILPDPGKVLVTLLYNGEDVTDQVTNGVFTAPSLVRDAELTAVFADAPAAPDDKTYDISGIVTDASGNPIPGATLDMGGRTDVTRADGTFHLSDVPSGTHTVVIFDSGGQVIGHGQITIEKADTSNLVLTTDADGNPVLSPGTSTRAVRLDLMVSEDGSITATASADATPVPSQLSPKTGDRVSQVLLIVILLIFIRLAALSKGGGIRKRKHK